MARYRGLPYREDPQLQVPPYRSGSMQRCLGVACLLLETLFLGSEKKYRPEDHYMRGPGPKWRAKHLADHGSGPGS